jgi:hypothetical protein
MAGTAPNARAYSRFASEQPDADFRSERERILSGSSPSLMASLMRGALMKPPE